MSSSNIQGLIFASIMMVTMGFVGLVTALILSTRPPGVYHLDGKRIESNEYFGGMVMDEEGNVTTLNDWDAKQLREHPPALAKTMEALEEEYSKWRYTNADGTPRMSMDEDDRVMTLREFDERHRYRPGP